jgi:hypothetical protein
MPVSLPEDQVVMPRTVLRADVVAFLNRPMTRQVMMQAVSNGRSPALSISRDLATRFGIDRRLPPKVADSLNSMIRVMMWGEDFEPSDLTIVDPADVLLGEGVVYRAIPAFDLLDC